MLTDKESERLAQLETVIQRGMHSFLEVGKALSEIRDARLYRTTHKSFDDYCKDKWGFSAQEAHHKIERRSVCLSLPNSFQSKITNAEQARALLEIKPSKRVAVLEKALQNGKLSSGSIRKAGNIPAYIARRFSKEQTTKWIDSVEAKAFAIIDQCPGRRGYIIEKMKTVVNNIIKY